MNKSCWLSPWVALLLPLVAINLNASNQPTLTISGSVVAVAPPTSPAAVLYDQTDSSSGVAISSQDFETEFDTYDTQAADDFSVPAGEIWTINEIYIPGQYWNGTGPVGCVNLYFYENVGALPGMEVYNAPCVPWDTDDNGSLTIPLSTPAVLSTGTYWLSVQARMDFYSGGQWGWAERTVQSNSESAWRNPGGGFGTGCTDWGYSVSGCSVGIYPDLLFRLSGESAPATRCPEGSHEVTVLTEGFEDTFPPPGWTVFNNAAFGVEWTNTDPGGRTNRTGGTGLFAIADSDAGGLTDTSTELWTPAIDLTGLTDPLVTFRMDYHHYSGDQAALDVSTDDGTSWSNLATWTGDRRGPRQESFATPGAGADGVRVRWDYDANYDWWWQVDEVEVTACAAGVAQVEVPVDIRPAKCPNPLDVYAKGVLPVAVLGTESLPVIAIDPTTVLLAGVKPFPIWPQWMDVATPYEPLVGKPVDPLACNKYRGDGYWDLVLYFDNSAIVAALGEVVDGQVLKPMLTGNLLPTFGGTPIIGEDVVKIVKRKIR